MSALQFVAALMLLSCAANAVSMESEPVSIAVLDLDYVDTSGEPRDQAHDHENRMRLFMQALRKDLEASGRFIVVDIECDPAPCSIVDSEPEHLMGAAKAAGARLLLFGGIHKMSTLVQFAKVQVVDVERNAVVLRRSLSFRGDDDRSWLRMERFLVGQLNEAPLR